MSGDIVGLVLIGGAVATWPVAYWVMINSTANFNATLKNTYTDDRPLIDGGDRALAIFVGLFAAAIWPVAAVVGALYLIFSKVTLFTPIAERQRQQRVAAKAQERELEELRRQVREYRIKGGEEL